MFYLRSLSLEGLQHLLRGCVSTKFRKEWSMKLWDSNVLVHTMNWDIHCTVWYQLQTLSLPSYLLVSLGFVFVFEFSFVLVVAFVLVFVFAFFLIFVFVWSDHLINCRRTDGTVIGCSVAAVAWRRRRIFRICNLLCLYLPILFHICNYVCKILSPRPASIIPKPQPTPPCNDPREHTSGLYISRKILNINKIRNELIEIYTKTHRRDSCMKGSGKC